MPRGLKLYVAGVVAAGAATLALFLPTIPFGEWPDLALWLAFLMVFELFPVTTSPAGSVVTAALQVEFAAVLLFGPGVGVLFGAVGAVLTNVWRRAGRVKLVFNVAQLSLSLGVAGLVYQALGGASGLGPANSIYRLELADIAPVLAFHVTHFILNQGLVTVALGLSSGTSPLQTWRTNYLWVLPQSLSVSACAVLFALLYLRLGVIPVVTLFAWVLLFTRNMRRILELRDSHRRTFVMLAAAADAAVPHLKARSERVASLAARLAREMGLSVRRRQLVEYAGLLHNVGMLGPGDPDEHGARGAAILEEVPSLRRVARVLRYHHAPEGNGERRRGMPLESRILRVAEEYEILTGACENDAARRAEALGQLRASVGNGLTRRVVDAMSRLDARGELTPPAANGRA